MINLKKYLGKGLFVVMCSVSILIFEVEDMDETKSINNNNAKEEDSMNAVAIRKINKTNISGLTSEKKKLLKSLQGIATSSIDFNKIRDEQKYGEDRF